MREIKSDPPGRLKLVLLDCDGTIVDSGRSIVAAMTEAWAALDLGPAPAPAAIRHIVGLPLIEGVAQLIPQADDGLHRAISEAYRAAFLDLRRTETVEEPLYPGFLEALDVLEETGALLGVATGKAMRGLRATLGGHGLMERFVTFQTADGGPGKPHPRMVLDAMSATGVAPADTLMIGDTSYDILMAKSAGVGAIGVTWGYHDPDTLMAAGADRLVHDWAAMADAVAEMLDSGQ